MRAPELSDLIASGVFASVESTADFGTSVAAPRSTRMASSQPTRNETEQIPLQVAAG